MNESTAPKPTILSAAIAALLAAPALQAATITVNSNSDDGTGCTLREAIANANADSGGNGCDPGSGDDSIEFSSVTGSIVLTDGQLEITDNLTINGPGEDQLAVDGNDADRVLSITGNSTVAMDGLTITNGHIGSYRLGGGISCDAGTSLTLTNSTVSGNTAGEYTRGGGISVSGGQLTLTNSTVSDNGKYIGGGIYVFEGELTLTNSTVSDNAGNSGIDSSNSVIALTNSTVSDNGGTGIHFFNSSVTLTNSTVSGNGDGGIDSSGGELTLTNSTVSGNRSESHFGRFGGIYANLDKTTLINSTVSGNHAGGGGGGIMLRYGELILINSTVSGNRSAPYDGGGIYVNNNMGWVTAINSIIANNAASDVVINGANNVVWGVDNMVGRIRGCRENTCGLGSHWNAIGVDPELDPLADNGCVVPAGAPGSASCVQTHALRALSPAVNAGWEEVCLGDAVHDVDQRGFLRWDTDCDIGAYEFGASMPPTISLAPDIASVPRGDSLGYTATLTSNWGTEMCVDVWTNVTLPSARKHPRFGELFGPQHVCVPAFGTREAHFTEEVPINAPLGGYAYNAFLGSYPFQLWDEARFDFTVTEATASRGATDWQTVVDKDFEHE